MLMLAVLAGAQQPNTNALYQQLRTLLPGGEVVSVSGLNLQRDAAVFTLTGNVVFYGEVNGKDTGAVFIGNGHLHITPPTAEERHNLEILNHSEAFDEDFDEAVFRFTDSTAAELRRSSTGGDAAIVRKAIQAAEEFRSFARTKLHQNYDLRILEDVLSTARGGYFTAAMHSHKNPHMLLEIDPHGATDVAPEEIALHNWSDWGDTILLAFHNAGEYANGGRAISDEVNESTSITGEDLDVTIEKGGFLSAVVKVNLTAKADGVAVVPFALYKTLRVSNVESAGVPLDFVQEKKDDDPDFGVILKTPLKEGQSVTVSVTYGGKDVVMNEGGANYYPIARESWYPNSNLSLGSYSNYRMTFRVPKGLTLIATGTKSKEYNEGKYTVSEWKTEVPLPVIGFNLGKFKTLESKVPTNTSQALVVTGYANEELPDTWKSMSYTPSVQPINTPMDDTSVTNSINTVSMLPLQVSEGTAAAQIYTEYFGEIPFSHIALTQQFACDYGQSWPMLVYLPICGFLDQTQKHFLGLHPEDMYWKVVTAHEVAHQWWGQTVGFRGYRDQWMSEGFANASAAQFLLMTRKKPDDYRNFWKEQARLITEKNEFGFRPIDVGPVTMGTRLVSPKAGWNIYQDLVYPKGAYILHMVQQMMWTPQDGDARFKAAMHELISAHKLQPVTTEDFKAALEKYMSPQMDLDRNHRLDWFFNEYVYGTALPNYHFDSSITHEGDKDVVHIKLAQSNVTPEFKMAVPIYIELSDDRIIRLGSANVAGNNTVETQATLPKLPSPPKRLMINYFYDVLCTEH